MNPQNPNPLDPNQNAGVTSPNPIQPTQPPIEVLGQNPNVNPIQQPANPTFQQMPINPVQQPTPFGSVGQPLANTPANPSNKNKLMLIVAGVVIFLIIIIGVILALSLKPAKNSVTNKNNSTTAKTSETKKDDSQNGLVCKEFAPADFDVIVNGAPDKTDGFFVTYKSKSGKNNVFFKYLFTKGTNNYESKDVAERSIQSVIRFNEQNQGNKWSLSLSGSFLEDTEANKKLASQRTEKVKSELIKAGIPETRIIVKEPAKATGTSFNYVDIDDRYVQAIIGANCS